MRVINAMKAALGELKQIGPGRQWQRMANIPAGEMAFVARLPSEELRALDHAITEALLAAEARSEAKKGERQRQAEADLTTLASGGRLGPDATNNAHILQAEMKTLRKKVYELEALRRAAPVTITYTDERGVPDGGARVNQMAAEKTLRDAMAMQREINRIESERMDRMHAAKQQAPCEFPGALDLWGRLITCRDIARFVVQDLVKAGHSPGSAQDALDALQNIVQNYRLPNVPAAPPSREQTKRDAEAVIRTLDDVAPHLKDVAVRLAAHGLPGWGLLSSVSAEIARVKASLPWRADG